MKQIELVYFSGCPNVERARVNLRAACAALSRPPAWTEWDLLDERAPARVRGLGSPTVLVDGEDVTGADAVDALACRAGGSPSVEQIAAALRRRV